MAFSVVLDTCVLYPAYLRDTLLRLAAAETYRPLWSQQILDELSQNLAARVGHDRATRLVQTMTRAFGDALVTGHEALTATMTNHPKDRHVLAAAVHGDANAILTFNLADFPEEAAAPYDLDVLHPDEFLLDQLDLAPGPAFEALRRQVASYRNPAMNLHALAVALKRAGCPQTAEELAGRR